MKINGYRCDRCGKTYKARKSCDKKQTIGFAFVKLDLTLDRYDLCDECAEQLYNWYDDPRKGDSYE